METPMSRRILLLVTASFMALVMAIPSVSAQTGENLPPCDNCGGGDPGRPDPDPPGDGGGGGNKDRNNSGDRDNGGNRGGNDGFTLFSRSSSDFDDDFDLEDEDFFVFDSFLFLFADELCSPLNPDAVNELVPGCIFAD